MPRRQDTTPVTPPSPSAASEEPRGLGRPVVAALGTMLAVACALVVLSFHVAAKARGGQLHHSLFWAGMLAAFVPLTGAVLARRARPLERTVAVLALASFTTLPKLLRNFTGPLFHDEFAHWRQTVETLETGELGHPNAIVRMASEFPGLHVLTSNIARHTGLSVWDSALVVIVVAHVIALLGVYAFVRELSGSSRVAAVGAVIYATNPSWLFFDSQFAYETLALPLAIWSLVLTLRLLRADGRAEVVAAVAGAVALTGVTVATHHLTAMAVWVIQAVMAVAITIRAVRTGGRTAPDARPARAWLPVLAASPVMLLFLAGRWHALSRYLGPSLERGAAQLSALFSGPGASTQSGQHRRLFGQTALPLYEVAAGLVLPFALALAFGGALWLTRRRWASLPAAATAVAAVGLAYFASLPFLLTLGGAEGARRSWVFSYLGLALVIALGVDVLVTRWPVQGAARRRAQAALLAAGLGIVAVGGVAAGQNVSYRFPGGYEVGNDARAIDEEGRALADWMQRQLGNHHRVIADRYSGMLIGSFGRQDLVVPSNSFPAWDLYFEAGPPSPELIDQLRVGDVEYLVVDRRMATDRPGLGYWFTGDEPGRGGDRLAPAAALRRLDCLPWTAAVYASEHLTLYRLDLDAYDEDKTAAISAAVASGECT